MSLSTITRLVSLWGSFILSLSSSRPFPWSLHFSIFSILSLSLSRPSIVVSFSYPSFLPSFGTVVRRTRLWRISISLIACDTIISWFTWISWLSLIMSSLIFLRVTFLILLISILFFFTNNYLDIFRTLRLWFLGNFSWFLCFKRSRRLRYFHGFKWIFLLYIFLLFYGRWLWSYIISLGILTRILTLLFLSIIFEYDRTIFFIFYIFFIIRINVLILIIANFDVWSINISFS